ncbi:50S ribosomal protein L10 [Methanosarcinales archaeon]|nr:MAG: 50S ribosomal protein L10 [Methanosarcinales archaeon]
MTESDVARGGVRHTTHIPQWKLDEVAEIKRLIEEYNVFGLVALRGISSGQLQKIRRETRGKLVIKVARNNLIRRALTDIGGEVTKMIDYIEDQTAIVYSNLNPFKLYDILESMKVPAPIKGGTVSPIDITIEKGPTPFNPGPIVGELQKAGIPAAIEGGKVVIKTTKTVVRAGETVSKELASMLTRLEIYPLTVGLDVRAIYEDGMVFEPEMLVIDVAATVAKLEQGYRDAFNLAMHCAYPTDETIIPLIQKAFKEGYTLALEGAIPAPAIIGDLLQRAHRDLIQIASLLADTDALDEDLKATLELAPESLTPVKEAKEVVKETEEATEEAAEDEEEKVDEEAAAGLGSLFG